MISVYIIESGGKRYVGVTTNARRRLGDHFKADTLVGRHLRRYGGEMRVVSEHEDRDEAFLEEQRLIVELRTLAPTGLNCTAGGEGLIDPPKETRDKLRRALVRRIRDGSFVGSPRPRLTKEQSDRQRAVSSARMKRLNQDATFQAKALAGRVSRHQGKV